MFFLLGVFFYAEIMQLLTPILAWQPRESINEHRASRCEGIRNEDKIPSRGLGEVGGERHILASVKLLEILL